MKTWWFLLSLIVLLAAQHSLAEDDIGEISDDGFDPPTLMNTSGGEGKSTTKVAVNKEEDGKKKEGKATGSVEKGEKTDGKIVDGKKAVIPSESKDDADKGMIKAPKATALAKSAEKETTKTEKKPVLPKSEEKDEKETPIGEKIVMVNSSDKDKKEKEAKEDALKTNVIPSKEKSTKVTEEDKKVSFYCFIISIHLFIIIAV
ncbi:hypothetical protein PRIPAC_79749 [Pristionchus pacificus]|nr:hypothetical protein PRIPAC_79749 [Pristionchus pacificus]